MTDVFDVHVHLFEERDWLPEEFWEGFADIVVRENEKKGRDISRRTVHEKYIPTYLDPDGQKALQRMDEAGIDQQVIFAIDFGVLLDGQTVPIREVNRRIAALQDEHPDRFIGFATVDPRRDEAVELVETALGEWGMHGLKLHPTAGFHLHDPETYRLLEVAADHDVPVLTDSGPINAPMYSKYSHPMHVDELLVDFPGLDLIVAHMSLGWWRELHAIADMNTATNMHVDISGWQDRVEHQPREFLQALRRFIDSLGADRVHFATDDPLFDPVYPKEEWIETIRSLAYRPDEPTFTSEEIDLVLGGAARLFD